MYYKLGQACVTHWDSFVLLQIRANVVTNWGSFIITNQGKCCYKLGQLLQVRATVIRRQSSYYKLGQNVLQIGAGITDQGNRYYKIRQLLQIGAKCITIQNKKTLYVVTIAIICSNLASLWKFQYFRRPIYNPVKHM